MERLTVVCWKWRADPDFHTTYTAAAVNTLRAMVARHYSTPHDFACITDDPTGIAPDIRIIPLWEQFADIRGPHGVSCYRRLRAFSAEAAEIISPRFVSVDLDAVITGDLSPLWDRPEDFVIWGDTARNTPYNGSMWLLRAGTRTKVWETFDPHASPKQTLAAGLVGSDQAWIAAALGDQEPRWGPDQGVYSWRVHLKRRNRGALPVGARVVFFHGREKPWNLKPIPSWIKESYQ